MAVNVTVMVCAGDSACLQGKGGSAAVLARPAAQPAVHGLLEER